MGAGIVSGAVRKDAAKLLGPFTLDPPSTLTPGGVSLCQSLGVNDVHADL